MVYSSNFYEVEKECPAAPSQSKPPPARQACSGGHCTCTGEAAKLAHTSRPTSSASHTANCTNTTDNRQPAQLRLLRGTTTLRGPRGLSCESSFTGCRTSRSCGFCISRSWFSWSCGFCNSRSWFSRSCSWLRCSSASLWTCSRWVCRSCSVRACSSRRLSLSCSRRSANWSRSHSIFSRLSAMRSFSSSTSLSCCCTATSAALTALSPRLLSPLSAIAVSMARGVSGEWQIPRGGLTSSLTASRSESESLSSSAE
mmetsp:Transcript_24630/g.35334  ORF Transcript_24630/g.35334 Transcript_24630/m.35334 type:complete len:256 (+) Transcript_24630:4799-5566(+)